MPVVTKRKGWFTIVAVLGLLGVFLFGIGFGFWVRDFRFKKPAGQYDVVRVVDGDTIVVSTPEGNEKVRLVGVNTPESVDPRKSVECFGKEASRHTAELLNGKAVRLEPDQHAGERDRYGRLLRYVYLPDGTLLNLELVRDGYAHENGYGHAYAKRDEFRAAEREARDAKRGLWNPATCMQQQGDVARAKQKK